MNPQTVRSDIQQLEAMRREAQIWRLGTLAALLVITLGSLTLMRNSVNGLLQPGPTQDVFTKQLGANLQRNVVPSLQTLASQTIAEMRPQVEAEFTKLNTRVPEVSGAFAKEMVTLQSNVSQSGQKTLENTLGAMLTKKEDQIKTQYPDATDDKIKSLIKNVNDEAAERVLSSRDKLFSKHLQSLDNIVGSLTTIHDTEPTQAAAQGADWETVISIFDLVHDDIHNLAPGVEKASMSKAPAGKAPAAANKPKAKEASNVTKGY